ncbi:class I SAM-dependent methyltransferase [Sodalinema gerasimenkoae]|uniref:class I SAM-dependent methyltransferase n=1 Tax=Sodalinema gerasimenkoae TaxID=2862348 RepID=UPI00135986C6|nr:class I SAM-dependent methyltransferase [Sodalinema gerasimenkoae]
MSKTVYPGEIFPNTHDFDEGIRTLLPRYTEMLDSITRCVPADCSTLIDLGCGTGELSLRLLERCPQAQVLAIDYSPRMLEFAHQKITQAGYNNRWEPLCADFGELAHQTSGDVAIQGAQACVSSLAIHHLSDEMKQTLFNWVFSILEPGGCFWNTDPVVPETPHLKDVYQSVREEWAQKKGDAIAATRAKVGESVPQGHSGQDRLASLQTHLQMLTSAGFQDVAIPWKYFGFAVFGGYRGIMNK